MALQVSRHVPLYKKEKQGLCIVITDIEKNSTAQEEISGVLLMFIQS